eukprot:786010-Prymnesium_polylepis.1
MVQWRDRIEEVQLAAETALEEIDSALGVVPAPNVKRIKTIPQKSRLLYQLGAWKLADLREEHHEILELVCEFVVSNTMFDQTRSLFLVNKASNEMVVNLLNSVSRKRQYDKRSAMDTLSDVACMVFNRCVVCSCAANGLREVTEPVSGNRAIKPFCGRCESTELLRISRGSVGPIAKTYPESMSLGDWSVIATPGSTVRSSSLVTLARGSSWGTCCTSIGLSPPQWAVWRSCPFGKAWPVWLPRLRTAAGEKWMRSCIPRERCSRRWLRDSKKWASTRLLWYTRRSPSVTSTWKQARHTLCAPRPPVSSAKYTN